jgi:inner membrane protein
MPTIFSHAIAGFALARTGKNTAYRTLTLAAALSAVVPDLDGIGFFMGVPYEGFFGHRGFTHSIAFAVLWSSFLVLLFFRKMPWSAFAVLFLATVSHPLLDMFTDGGLGCALFAPFNNERLFFAWRPIEVSPIGPAAFFSQRGLAVLFSEMKWVWLPSAGLLFGVWWFRRRGLP